MGWLTKEKLEQIIQRTRDGGAEIVGSAQDRFGLLRAGGFGHRSMAESYLKDKKRHPAGCAAFSRASTA